MAPRGRGAGLTRLGLATTVLASALVGVTLTGTLSAFTAQITNSGNSAGSGYILLQEEGYAGDGSSIYCNSSTSAGGGTDLTTNSYTCSAIKPFNASGLTPGSVPITGQVLIRNTGTSALTGFTLAKNADCSGTSGSPSSSSSPTSAQICAKFMLRITAQATGQATPVGIYDGPLGSFSSQSFTLKPAPSSASQVRLSFQVSLPTTAGAEYSSTTASLPLIWRFQA